MEIDGVEYTFMTVRVGVMREPADCCQEKTTSGGCDCQRDESEEAAIDLAMEYLGTDVTPIDVVPSRYGYTVTFERADL